MLVGKRNIGVVNFSLESLPRQNLVTMGLHLLLNEAVFYADFSWTGVDYSLLLNYLILAYKTLLVVMEWKNNG